MIAKNGGVIAMLNGQRVKDKYEADGKTLGIDIMNKGLLMSKLLLGEG